ncbi:uncharacterized protein [Euwallacea similis]|uniref:uncharacterized protein n=1 Tax=Euwallacea similis TaxID=1736056 RepID=UPI003450B044
MGFCKLCCCFKIFYYKYEDRTDIVPQEEPPPIVVQPLPLSSTSVEPETKPETLTIFDGTRTNSANSENFFDCYTTDPLEDAQHQNATTTNFKSRIPSIFATLDSPKDLRPTISSLNFPTENPSIPKSSANSSVLNHSSPYRGKPTISINLPKIPKPQVHGIWTQEDSLKPEPKNVSIPLKTKKEEKEEEILIRPAFLHLDTSTKTYEDSFPKLQVANSTTQLPVAVPLEPDVTVPLAKHQSRPATTFKPVTPLKSHTQSQSQILSALSLIYGTSHSLVRSSSNEELLKDLLSKLNVCHIPLFPKTTAYQLESLDSKSTEFVYNILFRNKKFRSCYEIKAVKRVWNPYLMLHYELNQNKYGGKFKRRFMYHGTSLDAANAILKYNFNWRMCNEFNFGKGVYFANNPYFASHYGKRSADPRIEDYVMIVARVLIEEEDIQTGFPHLLPPAGHTATSVSKQEFIKFDDCVFYPEFLVFFRPF